MYEEQIAAGMIELEDRLGDDFHTKIDLAALNVGDGDRCILGQLYTGPGHHSMSAFYLHAQELGWDEERCAELGLNVGDGFSYGDVEAKFEQLTEEWAVALRVRTEAMA
jgi:hypothetical protein